MTRHWNTKPKLMTGLMALLSHVAVTWQLNVTSQMPIIRLHNDFIDPYDSFVRPVSDPKRPTNVSVRMNFLQLLDVNEMSSTLTVNIWLEVSWHDDIRHWNPDDYSGIDHMHLTSQNDIWRPTLIAINSNDERLLFETQDSSVYILNDGRSYWLVGQSLSFACALDLTQFPFDSQECNLTILSRHFSDDVIFINGGVGRADQDVSILESVFLHSEWDVDHIASLDQDHVGSGIGNRSFEAFSVCFHLSRKPGFFVLNTLVPVNALTLLSFFTFLIPDDSGEKISYAVTLLLSCGVYMSSVSTRLPQTPENIPMVVVYLFCLNLYHALAMLVAMLVIIYRRKYAIDNKTDVTESTAADWLTKEGDLFSVSKKHNFDGENRFILRKRESVGSIRDEKSFPHIHGSEKHHNKSRGAPGENDVMPFQVATKPKAPSSQVGGTKRKYPCSLDPFLACSFFATWLVLTIVFVVLMTK